MISATTTNTAHEGADPSETTCPCCAGRGRATCAGARCAFCGGDGVVHRVLHATLADGSDYVHPGSRALCDVRACRRPSLLLAVGARFWSQGLQAPCRVLRVDAERLAFESESTTEDNIRTDVALELAVRHLQSGRWRLLTD